MNTSARTEQYLKAHKETNNTDYSHTSTNHVRLPGLEGREIDSRLPGPDTLRSNFACLLTGSSVVLVVQLMWIGLIVFRSQYDYETTQ